MDAPSTSPPTSPPLSSATATGSRASTAATDATESATKAASERKAYDSPVRRHRQAETRDRIVRAGSELARGFQEWDWRRLTFRAVAERAGVSERTVYRYFANERELHDAVMGHLHQEAGVSYEGIDLDDLPPLAATVFASLSSFAARYPQAEPAFPTVEQQRRTAVSAAIDEAAGDWSEIDRRKAAAVLDVVWSVPSFERMVTTWELEPDQAADALTWLIGLATEAIRDGRRPGG